MLKKTIKTFRIGEGIALLIPKPLRRDSAYPLEDDVGFLDIEIHGKGLRISKSTTETNEKTKTGEKKK